MVRVNGKLEETSWAKGAGGGGREIQRHR